MLTILGFSFCIYKIQISNIMYITHSFTCGQGILKIWNSKTYFENLKT